MKYGGSVSAQSLPAVIALVLYELWQKRSETRGKVADSNLMDSINLNT